LESLQKTLKITTKLGKNPEFSGEICRKSKLYQIYPWDPVKTRHVVGRMFTMKHTGSCEENAYLDSADLLTQEGKKTWHVLSFAISKM